MKKLFLFYLVLLTLSTAPIITMAQEKHTISGYIRDMSDGESLIGATAYVKELGSGTVSNAYGFYSITLASGQYNLEFKYLGYQTVLKAIDLKGNITLDIELSNAQTKLQEVVITESMEDDNVSSISMGSSRLDVQTIQKLPAFLGEADVLKSIQLLPGISSVGEGASGYNSRGGSVGQNLILLDEAPVYNSSHLFGFFSVFNPDAVKDTQLFRGAIPSKYGGRISSILDVRMKDGNNKCYSTSGGIGTVFSRLAFEGPIVKNKGSFIVAARRSYIDVLAAPFTDVLDDGAGLNFYDLTMKANYKLSSKDHVYLSGYLGRDRFMFDERQGFSWGNATSTLRWNHLFSDRLFSNFTLVYSDYDYELAFGDTDRDKFDWNSNINSYIFKPEFTYFLNSDNEMTFGGEAIYYTFEPANAVGVSNGNVQDISLDRKYNLETSVYIGNRQTVNPVLTLEYGLRFSSFRLFGPGTAIDYGEAPRPGLRRDTVSTTFFGSGKTIAEYSNFEPRLSFKVQLSSYSSIKGSYNRMAQYLHLISNTTASNPLDVWVPSSNNIEPQIGQQVSLGYFANLGKEESLEVSVEGYYRKAENQIDYIDGADLLINERLEGDLLSGEGRAYGLELSVKKDAGRFSGWMNYTIAKTELQVEGINRGEWYSTRFDQPHNFKIAAFYELNKRMTLSGNFVFNTGTPITFPTSRVIQRDLPVIPYNANDSRNNVRLPNYHRLDLALRVDGKKEKKGRVRKNNDYWVFSFINVYNRRNAFSIYFAENEELIADNVLPTEAVRVSIIGSIIPAISYNFNFNCL